jgi:site-specific recombinase XerD
MVSDVNKRLVDRFIRFRKDEGVGGWTINRDLKALRGALNHGWKNELISTVPFVHDVETKDKAKPRDLVYTPERVAAILEAAASREDRAHTLLYIMIAMSTCGRSEAILDMDASQIRDGCIHFLADDRQQTKKRRSTVPIAPTLAPWLEGIKGKVIVSRKPIAERKWRDPEIPEFYEYPCYDVGGSFETCLLEAGICREVFDDDDNQLFHPVRHKLGETEQRPKLKGLGTPNTLRHTIITEMHRRGVPEGQIDTAAGHVGEGTGKRNYRHLRPDYLAELIEAIESYWGEISRFTTVHLRSQHGPKIVSFASAKAIARSKRA